MFERYTERACRVLFFSRYEASQLGSVSIETEHVLLGLVREDKGLTRQLFAQANVDLETLRKEAQGSAVFREKVSVSVEIPFSEEVKRALTYTAQEADRLQHSYIGAEHMLLGLLHEESSNAGVILARHGLHLASVREDVVRLLAQRADAVGPPPSTPADIIAAIERIKQQVSSLADLATGGDDTETRATILADDIHRALDRLKSPWA